MWIALACLSFVPPLASAPGRYVADTKLPLWFATPRYLLDSLHVWQSSPYLGNEQHDGVLFPMGTFVGLLRAVHVPIWIVERLWHGSLLFVAAAGAVFLVDELRGRELTLAQPITACFYAFNPYALAFGLRATGVFVPYALLPLLLVVWIRGLRDPRGWRWPALLALVFFAMGGGNGAPQVYTLVPLVAYLAWAIWVDRSIGARAATGFVAKATVMTIALNAYWLVGLLTQSVSNDIAFSEHPPVINIASSFSESIRLLGFWGFYGQDSSGPWYPSLQGILRSPLLVFGSFLVPAAAFGGVWRSRWRFRALFVLLAVLAIVVMVGVYPPSHPTPAGQTLLAAYRWIPGASGLRTTYKIGSTLALSIAVLVGDGAVAGIVWLRRRVRWRGAVPLALATLVVGLCIDAGPLLSAHLYPDARTAGPVPTYWRLAIDRLQRSSPPGRVFFAPGSSVASYTWGVPIGGVPEANPQLPSVRRIGLPVMERYGSNLLAAIEQPYQGGPGIPGGTALLLRRLGVSDVVLQNDLLSGRSNTATPLETAALYAEPGLTPDGSFGRPGENVARPETGGVAAALARIPPVEVLRVADPIPALRAEVGSPVIVSGDGFGLPPTLALGLVPDSAPILYSGSLTSADLAGLARDRPSLVVTDSNRRMFWSFAGVRFNHSFVLRSGQGGPSVGYDLFGGRGTTQTAASFAGAAGVSASSYGSPLALQPWHGPIAAFDNDPSTSWTPGSASQAGQWVQATLRRPIRLSSVTVDPLSGGVGQGRLASVVLSFSDGSRVASRIGPGPTEVRFPTRITRTVRITIGRVTPSALGSQAVGIVDVRIPGVPIRDRLALPTDLIGIARATSEGRLLLAQAPLSFVFERAGGGAAPDEERGLDRTFDVPTARAFDLLGSVRLDPNAADDAIDSLLLGPRRVVATSSGRAGNDPSGRASLALDGNPATGWTANGTSGQWLDVRFPRHAVGAISMHAFTDPRHSPLSEVRISLSDGTSFLRTVGSDGAVHLGFRSRPIDSVRVVVIEAGLPVSFGGPTPPAGIRELRIQGVPYVRPPDASAAIPCYRGSGVTLDGKALPVRPVGTVGDLLSRRALPLISCDGPIQLSPGWHDFRASYTLQPSVVAFHSPGTDGSAPDSVPNPPQIAATRTWEGYQVRVVGSDAPFYLVLGENIAPGWHASIDGTSLGSALLIDGYSAGWRVEHRGAFTIDVTYGPQRRQDIATGVSAAAMVVVLGGLGVSARRRRRAR